MAENSGIEWTMHTFNPWWGCVKVSPACDRCYAETTATRYGFSEKASTADKFPIWGKDTGRRFFGDKHWNEPLKWNAAAEKAGERHRVFCGSMCDVMEDRRDLDAHRARLYRLIGATPHLDWLLLTKRPQNFRRFLPASWLESPRPNVWGMTTVESEDYWWRVQELTAAPFAVRGLSMEPLLGPVFLGHSLLGIHWVIVGGESGPGARPVRPDWVRYIQTQCKRSGVAFFFKQWGEWAPITRTDGITESPFGYDVNTKLGFIRKGKKKAGRLLDGRTWDEVPGVIRG